MTDPAPRLYAAVVAALVFFVSWAALAARPWASTPQDSRLAALDRRERQLRADARAIELIVAEREAAYRAALGAAASAPTDVRMSQLPPLTTTRSS